MHYTPKNKKIVVKKLLSFGFQPQEETYVYTTDLMDGQFAMMVTVDINGNIGTKVMDKASEEEYVLHLTEIAAGSFVGRIREEHRAVMETIIEQCFENDIFRSDNARKLIEYVRHTYGDEPEFLWKKFSDNAAIRRADNQKWYAVLLTVSKRKLGLDSDEIAEIVDVRMKPENVVNIVDHQFYFPGWHMNKKNWITIILDGSVDFDEICRRLDDSYQLACAKK